MKNYLKLIFATFLFMVSMAFAMQDPQTQEKQEKDESKKVKPLEVPATSKADAIISDVNALKAELEVERRKNDSVTAIRERNLSITQRSVTDLKKANDQYRKSLSRLKYVLERFDPDSVMKYYGEYKEPDTTNSDDSKKKTDKSVEVIATKRPNLFQRIFGRKN